jgi:hypothetical protein
MPAKPIGRTGLRTAAGLAPLALALLLQRSVLPEKGGPPPIGNADPVVCAEDIEGVQGCHDVYPTGCSPSGRYDAYLNLLKNQLPQPTAAPVRTLTQADYAKLDAGTPKDLSKANHADFKDDLAKLGEGQIHSVIAYLYYAKPSGQESSNCEEADADAIDFHIGIGFDPKLAAKAAGKVASTDHKKMEQTGYIVEMTPHFRREYKNEWSVAELKPVLGRMVKITGLLLNDNEHNTPKDNCYPSVTATCWRASTWELHPVIRFQVCNNDQNSCDEKSADWVDLEDYEPPAKNPTK